MTTRLAVVACLTACVAAHGQTVYNLTPDWVSSDTPYSTGGALVDLDRDGWLDLVVSNGNDMNRERLAVYYNQEGTFPALPDWQSADLAYNGHLDVADINGDGWPDVAVALLLNEGGPAAKVYMNNQGVLSSTPSWTCAEIAPSFGVAFGDVNGDGRPDLAVGTGDSYSGTPHIYKNTVHLNVNGQLEQLASWQSADTRCYESVLWTDADADGWLDLVGVGGKTYTWIYHNNGGVLGTTAAWQTTDNANQFGLMAAVGDVTGDGRRDLFIADNNQLGGGSGRFKQYNGASGGYFSQTANWSYFDGYCSAVALADVDADGDLDLATGEWWGYTRIFFNGGSGFGASPGWSCTNNTTAEKIIFGDIDKNSIGPRVQTFAPAGTRRLFYLSKQPIQEVSSVLRDGMPLTTAQYTYSREYGWISVSAAPATALEVHYTYSTKLDMVVTNWDEYIGNYLYYNQLIVKGDANCDGLVNLRDLDLFVLILTDRDAYQAVYPDCNVDVFCDMNDDGMVDGLDIQGFVQRLIG
jgi:hypothetical protein